MLKLNIELVVVVVVLKLVVGLVLKFVVLNNGLLVVFFCWFILKVLRFVVVFEGVLKENFIFVEGWLIVLNNDIFFLND